MTTKPTNTTRAIGAIIIAALLLVSSVGMAAALYDPATDGDVDPSANPAFPQRCGVNVMLVLDNSASLNNGNLTDVKTAANNSIDLLATTDTVSGVGVISFNQKLDGSDGADTRIAITELDSAADIQSVKDAVGGIQLPEAGTLTNWEAALLEASVAHNDQDGDVADENLHKPADLVILVSDGRPNAYGYPGFNGTDDGGTAFSEPIEAATLASNEVKSEDTRVIGVGFPDSNGNVPSATAFEAITDGAGSTTSGDVQDIDYYLAGNSNELSAILTGIAEEIDCGIAVEKLNDANNDSTFTDDETAPAPGDPVTYQVEVTNTGSIDLRIDSYVDDVYGTPVVSPALVGQTLAAGSSLVVTFEGTAPPENGVKVNTFNVTATDEDGFAQSDEDDTTVRSPDLAPSIAVEKLNDANNDSTFTDDETSSAPGDAVTYQVTVTNDGPNNVTIDSFGDDIYGTPVVSPGLVGVELAPGESIVVTFEGSSPASEDTAKTNTFNVSASDDEGDVISDEDDTTVRSPDLTPSIVVEKLNDANNDSTFTDDETSATPGDAVTYRVTVTNDGPNNVTIDSFGDDIYGSPVVSPALVGVELTPGESIVATFEGSTPVTEDTAKTNTFNVTAIDTDDDVANDEDQTTVRSPDLTPSIAAEKLVDADGDADFNDSEEATNPDDDVTYQVTVTNDGPNNVTIDSFSDDVYGTPVVSPALVGIELAPGESITVTFNGTAPSTFDASKTNVFTVNASDADGDQATDSDDATVTTPPAMDICPRTPGFWKNHNGDYASGNNEDLTTDLLPITLGDGTGKSVVVDSDDVANDVFEYQLTADSHPSNGISKLYVHLLAAKLNTANGAIAPENVTDAMERSDEILVQYNESDWDDIKKNDRELAEEIEDLKDLLDRFNDRHFTGEDCLEDWWKEDTA